MPGKLLGEAAGPLLRNISSLVSTGLKSQLQLLLLYDTGQALLPL